MQLRRGDPEEVGMSPDRVRRIARLAQGWVASGDAAALVVLAARRGVIVLHEAFGCLGPEPDAPDLPRDAIFPVASISKGFTAAAVLILVEDGLLGLNRPVQEYLPEFRGEGMDRVLVHHLLTHTAGFEDDQLCAHLHDLERAGVLSPPDQPYHALMDVLPYGLYLAAATDVPLARPPGHEMSYSSFGFILLGQIVEQVASQSLPSFTRERIFLPLGMGDTGFGFPEGSPERVVRRAPDAKGTHGLGQPDWPRVFDAMGGACSTASDLAIFGQMLLNGGHYREARILSAATVAEMTRNQIPGIPARHNTELFTEGTWGLGLGVKGDKKALRHPTLDSAPTFSHGGAGGTYWWADPARELVGVYLSVTPHYYPDLMEKWNVDLFGNALTAAIDDN